MDRRAYLRAVISVGATVSLAAQTVIAGPPAQALPIDLGVDAFAEVAGRVAGVEAGTEVHRRDLWPFATAPGPAAVARGPVPGTVVPADDPRLAWTGRWHVTPRGATTVNSGSRLALAFTGRSVTLLLDTSGISHPAEILAGLDGGRPTLHTVTTDRLRLTAATGGRHVLEVGVKDVDEQGNRWTPPLRSALVVSGVALDQGARLLAPPALGGRRIAFFGDSITQGSRLVSTQRGVAGGDGTRAYPALTASAFRARALQVGFGGQGLLVGGVGGVPPAPRTLGWTFAGVPAGDAFVPDVIVVNQGTNDVQASGPAFRAAYVRYLRQIRAAYPAATVLALRPFAGRHAAQVRAAAAALRDPAIRYVDTSGWLARGDLNDSVHPNARGHARAAARLTQVVAAVTRWRPVAPRWSALPRPPGVRDGGHDGAAPQRRNGLPTAD